MNQAEINKSPSLSTAERIKIDISDNESEEQGKIRGLNQLQSEFTGLSEFDYLRILKAKEETIQVLTSYLETQKNIFEEALLKQLKVLKAKVQELQQKLITVENTQKLCEQRFLQVKSNCNREYEVNQQVLSDSDTLNDQFDTISDFQRKIDAYQSNHYAFLSELEDERRKIRMVIREYRSQHLAKQLKPPSLKDLQNAFISIKNERSELNCKSIEQELRELKLMVNQRSINDHTQEYNELIEKYYQLTHAYEAKIEENLTLNRQIDQIKARLFNQSKSKLLLNEKNIILQTDLTFYDRDLREMRYRFDQLLYEKIKIEKEMTFSKNLKSSRRKIQVLSRSSSITASNKMNSLIQFERQYCNHLQN